MFIRFLFFVVGVVASFGYASGQTLFPPIDKGAVKSLTIYSSLDEDVSKPLLEAFQKLQPNVEIYYYDLQSLEIYERTIDETDRGQPTADLVISSAMDLQVKLANDGYAQPVLSASPNWPKWATWQKSLFGLTFEPSVIVYHKPSFAGLNTPKNRTELRQLLLSSDDGFFGRVGTYDIERSGLGFLFLARDAEHDRNLWKLVNAMGTAGVKLYSSSSSILERVSDGRLAVGYNILGSYARAWAEKNPAIGITLPEDFTVVMSRIALVPKSAQEPQLGRDMLAFLMSKTGQSIMAEQLKLPAIHPLVTGPNTASAFRKKFGRRLRPIKIGPGLVAYLDQVKRTRFIKHWNKSLRGE